MYITLNITATSLRLLSVKGRQVKKWGSIPLSPGLVRDGLILQPKAVGAAIDALFKSTKIPKEQVITSLSGLSFTHRILSLPRMKPDLLEEALQRAARKEMPLPLEELYLSWQAIDSRPDELDFLVLGVPRNLIDAMVQTLAEAGVKPYLMDLKPLALARAANRGDAIIVALEPDCFDIVIVANGIPSIMHTITPRGEGASLEDNTRHLTDELLKTVKFYNDSHPENPLSPTTPLLLTGELSGDAATSQLIQAEMEFPIEPLASLLEVPPDLPVALYATNMGLALKKVPQKAAAGFCDINLNIMSGKYNTRAGTVPIRRRLLPLALIVAIGFLFPMYQLKSRADVETTRLLTELSTIGQELHQARLVGEEASRAEDAISEVIAEAESLEQEHQQILGEGNDFANNLRLVTDALPPEAYFTSIAMGTDQFTVEGEARRPSVVIRYATTLEQKQSIPEVRIAEIGESNVTEAEDTEDETENTEEESTNVSFSVVINK